MNSQEVFNYLNNIMQRGQMLYTRDGRKRGNAIMLGVRAHPLLRKTVYQLETDFGNRSELTREEILNQYFVTDTSGNHVVVDPVTWRANKAKNAIQNSASD